jgi:hypothetical protein
MTTKNNKKTDELHRILGSFVLQLLESDTDWSAETVDEISRAAMDLGLAHTDKNGYFKASQAK